mgnify:FL=1
MIIERMDRVSANLQREEGFSSHAYQDHLGVWTIGFGRNVDKENGGPGITHEEGQILLLHDIQRVASELVKKQPWVLELDLDRRECLVEISFQLGYPRFAKFKKMLAALKAGQFAVAAAELIASRYHKQTPARVERYAARLRG